MHMEPRIFSGLIIFSLLAQLAGAQTPTDVPDLSGMWSDPPARAEDAFCHVGCTVAARDYLTQLLDDPDNFDRSYAELGRKRNDSTQRTETRPPYARALENYPFTRHDSSLTQWSSLEFTADPVPMPWNCSSSMSRIRSTFRVTR